MPQNIPNMPRNIAETFFSGVWQNLCNLRSFSDLVISHLRLYSVVLCLFISFCYRAALRWRQNISPLSAFSSFSNAPVRRCYFGIYKFTLGFRHVKDGREAPLETLTLIFVNNQLDAQFLFSCMFISILYIFRAAMCPSSGELYQYDIWYMSL